MISNINSSVQAMTAASGGRERVIDAIRQASAKSGVDFAYMLNKANQESSLNPSAKASGSSATGLYQFIDQTWLKTVKEHGADYGLSEYADQIQVGSDGVARVSDPAVKKQILALRNDPEISADMAAELAKQNKEELTGKVRGKIGSTEMYMAHFLGSGGAAEFLNAMKTDPNAKAADILPSAAAANKGVFYDRETGEAKSVGQIYAQFSRKFDAKATENVMLAAASSNASKGNATTRVPLTRNAGRTRIADANSDMNAIDQMMASMGAGASSAAGGESAMSVMNGMKLGPTTSTPFAAMMLAQMDMQSFGTDAMSHIQKIDNEIASNEAKKKSTLSMLANAA